MKHIYEKDTFVTKDIAAKINKACSLSYPALPCFRKCGIPVLFSGK